MVAPNLPAGEPGLVKSRIFTNTSGHVTLNAVKGLSGEAVREILRCAQNDMDDDF